MYFADTVIFVEKFIKFDILNLEKKFIKGEVVLETLTNVEDSKGNPEDIGRLFATNLRLIWHSITNKKYNLSIGFGCIVSMHKQNTLDKLNGIIQVLYVLAVNNGTRYEFFFTDLSEHKHQECNTFDNILEIHQLYQRTLMYRELKLRGAIIQHGHLILLPREEVFNTVPGVMNLSSDQGNLGVFVITNIRLVWYADTNENFNISLSYLQLVSIRVRNSKYGLALVLETTVGSGGFVLGFRIDPEDRLHKIEKELITLQSSYLQQPIFGVDYIYSKSKQQARQLKHVEETENFFIADFVEIDEKQEREIHSKLNNYLAKGSLGNDTIETPHNPVYYKEMGFAMEKIPDDYTFKDLWDILPTQMYNEEL